MNDIFGTFHPILILAGIVLNIAAVYTALDMFMLINASKGNKITIFLGAAFSMGIGICMMNLIDLMNVSRTSMVHNQLSMIILSLIIGMTFTGLAFYYMLKNTIPFQQLIIAAIFLSLAVLTVQIIGVSVIKQSMNYNFLLILFAGLLIFGSLFFTFWFLFYSQTFPFGSHSWLKPLASLIITGAIVEGHFLLFNAPMSLVTGQDDQSTSIFPSSIFYIVVVILNLILIGFISTIAIISKRLTILDTNLKDIKLALDESTIITISDASGKIIYMNDKFEEISKFSREEIMGSDHRILNSGYHSKAFFQSMWTTIHSGEIWKGEICNKAKDGTIYWVDTTIFPFLNALGKPYQFISFRTDISERKRAEEHLKETLKENNDIKFALDQSSIVAFTDDKGIITSANEKFCEISKYDRSELIGKNHSILNSGYHSKEYFHTLWKTITAGKVWKGEIQNKAKDGSYYWVDTTIVPFLNNDGKPYQYLSIRNDITERKQTEEILHRQDKLAAIGQLAAGVAHEIRNPLTSMKGFTELLLLDELNPERSEFLNIILDEINRVNIIVEDFMVLAKPKAVILEERNVVPVIENVVSLLAFEVRKKNVRLHFDCHEEIIQIECDENRLKQVFLNFIKNGIEAMPNGGDLHVKVNIQDGNVQISIQDTGVGIPEEKIKKLGEPFYTTKKNGNGLGLMVSFKIIESHNGKVYVESERNKGTTFNILLPAKTA